MKLIHLRVNNNFKELLAAGLDRSMAVAIAIRMKMRVVLNVAVADNGVTVSYYEDRAEKLTTFKFDA